MSAANSSPQESPLSSITKKRNSKEAKGSKDVDRGRIWRSIAERVNNKPRTSVGFTLDKVEPEAEAETKGRWCSRCCGLAKEKPETVTDEAFVPFPSPMQPDVPATPQEKAIAVIAAFGASTLLSSSIAIAKVLMYTGVNNSVEIVFFYQFLGNFLTALPSFLFFRHVSVDRRKIWRRLLGDEQYINYKRGAMCWAYSLCTVITLISIYYSLRFVAPGDVAVVYLGAPIVAAAGAVIFKKRPMDWVPFGLLLVVVIVIVLVFLALPNVPGVIISPASRPMGVGLSMMVLSVSAVNHHMLRFLRYVHWSITQFVLGSVGFFMASIFVLFNRVPFTIPIGYETNWYVALSLTSWVGEGLWMYGHRYLPIPTLGAIRFVVEVTTLYMTELFIHGGTPNALMSVACALSATAVLGWAVKECWDVENGRERKPFPRCFSAREPSPKPIL